MNKEIKDRIWELASSELHNESVLPDLQESVINKSDLDFRQIKVEVTRIHTNLKETAPLHHSTIFHSWNLITHYIKKKQLQFYLGFMRYTAIVIFGVIVGALISNNLKSLRKGNLLYSEIVAPLGQMSEMTLYDGTKVWLNSGTKLRYPNDFGQELRQVELDGEAFFRVKPGKLPFKVKLKNYEVEVMGTSFAAVAYPDEKFSQVTLVEGSVLINNHKGETVTELEPNQQINIPDNFNEKIRVREVSTLFYESWINGQIKFDEERLADVAHRLERWYNVEIRFEDEEVANLRFTGTVLKNKPIDQSMKAMSLLLPIKVEHKSNLESKDVIIISKK